MESVTDTALGFYFVKNGSFLASEAARVAQEYIAVSAYIDRALEFLMIKRHLI